MPRKAAAVLLGLLALLATAIAIRFGPVRAFLDVTTAIGDASMACVLYRADSARVSVDMRSLATAIECYKVDHGRYPAKASMPTAATDRAVLGRMGGTGLFATETGAGSGAHGITTPAAYLAGERRDLFTGPVRPRLYHGGRWFTGARERGTAPYAYDTDGASWWLLWSAGPDEDYDIQNAGSIFTSANVSPQAALSGLTWDPTNGTASNGDIWRAWRFD